LLELPVGTALSERDLRPIMAMLDWRHQRVTWSRTAGNRSPASSK
jgi:hypothetical protein